MMILPFFVHNRRTKPNASRRNGWNGSTPRSRPIRNRSVASQTSSKAMSSPWPKAKTLEGGYLNFDKL